MVCGFQGGLEVGREGDGEGVQLGCEASVNLSLGGFRVEDCGVVAEVVEMAGCY